MSTDISKYKGRGVSGWLTVATGYALNLWATVCDQTGDAETANRYRAGAREVNEVANKYFWDGDWFARGITDDGVVFGTKKDVEGRIWLNPQAWSILGGAANEQQRVKMISEVEKQLDTPYGIAMFGPPYSKMREDVGRVTQKYPGSGENASLYSHAAIFYIFSLYSIGENDKAYELLRKMLPGPSEEDYRQRGQLPVYIPNYYRGAWREYPRTAGRSSQLFNTGTMPWVYRCFVEGLCGLQGDAQGLLIRPQLPSAWNGIKVTRIFRGATFEVDIRRADVKEVAVKQDGKLLSEPRITNIESGAKYQLAVAVPK